MKIRHAARLAPALALSLLLAACGGGHAVVVVDDGYDSNPGLELVGLWTGTFTDSYGDYTASIEVDAADVVPQGTAGTAVIVWGQESVGLDMTDGDFVEIGDGGYSFVYDTRDPETGAYRDTVSGELWFTGPGLVEGTFETTSGTSGQVSFARNQTVPQSSLAGHYEMIYTDSTSRETYYLGEIEIDRYGTVIPGSWSYLTDDVSGPIDPGANVWPILDGWIDAVDPDTGYFEGELYFAAPEDTISLSGYFGTDLYVYAGVFDDALGTGLFTFLPID